MEDEMEEDVNGDMLDTENLNYDDLDSVLKLQKTRRYIDIMQLLGAKRKTLAGFLTATSQLHVRFVEQTEIFQSTPPLRNRACRILKSTLAARVDSIRGDLTGRTGRNLRDENLKKIEKWQEPPPAKMLKPLPVPDSEPKKEKRGSPPQENEGKVCSDRYEEACQQNAVWNTRRELIRDQEEMPLPLIHEDKISAVDTPEEDKLLASYISRYGHWNWRELPKYAGLSRCGKSCRLRWLDYLKPNIKRGGFTTATKQNRTSKGKEIEFEPQSSSSEFTSWSSYSEDLDVKDYLGNGSSISPESVFQFDDSSWMETGNTAIGMHLVVRKVPEFAKPRFLAKTRQDGLSDESFGSGRFESTLLIPDQMHGKRSIARLPNFSDPSTVPFKEEKAHLNTRGLTSSKVRCGPGFNLARK